MLRRLTLESFKNFNNASLPLGRFTLLVGANATGKSNLRDAFRFLHGVSRGYLLAEVMGEKWIEGGVLQWKGIRGGTRESTFPGASRFALTVEFDLQDGPAERHSSYRIEVEPGQNGVAPSLRSERLVVDGRGRFVFDSHPEADTFPEPGPNNITVRLRKVARKGFSGPSVTLSDKQPVLTQLAEHPDASKDVQTHVRLAISALSSMRFLDLDPAAMRLPSLPGQTVLGDRGENLSSVLQAICSDPDRKQALVQWLRELTPLDASDFAFEPDAAGRILLKLVEESSHETSAYSASDGTLRFLAMISALLGREPARFYFFEELENGIHPTRLHLLTELIERRVADSPVQVVATSHSPQLLRFLSPQAQHDAVLLYRLPGHVEAGIRRLADVPHMAEVVEEESLDRLHASGWLEDAVAFAEDGDGPA